MSRTTCRISASEAPASWRATSACIRYHSTNLSVSSLDMKAPWIRIGSASPGGRKSMSPFPRRLSAPFWSRIVRLSVFEATRNAIRLGKFALMRPVITFTDGRCVEMTR